MNNCFELSNTPVFVLVEKILTFCFYDSVMMTQNERIEVDE